MYFSTNLTLGIRTEDLHSIVRSRRPVVVPVECPPTKNHGPTRPPQTKSPRTATAAAHCYHNASPCLDRLPSAKSPVVVFTVNATLILPNDRSAILRCLAALGWGSRPFSRIIRPVASHASNWDERSIAHSLALSTWIFSSFLSFWCFSITAHQATHKSSYTGLGTLWKSAIICDVMK